MARRGTKSHVFPLRDLGVGGFAPRRSSRRGLVLICGLEVCFFAISGFPFQTVFGSSETVQLYRSAMLRMAIGNNPLNARGRRRVFPPTHTTASLPDQAFPRRQFTVGAEQMRQSP